MTQRRRYFSAEPVFTATSRSSLLSNPRSSNCGNAAKQATPSGPSHPRVRRYSRQNLQHQKVPNPRRHVQPNAIVPDSGAATSWKVAPSLEAIRIVDWLRLSSELNPEHARPAQVRTGRRRRRRDAPAARSLRIASTAAGRCAPIQYSNAAPATLQSWLNPERAFS